MGELAVVLVTGEYPPTFGGVGDYTALLAGGLRAAGMAATVVTGRGVGDEAGVRRAVPGWGVGGWPALLGVVRAVRPGVVHLQYQAGAFGGRAAVHLLPRLLRAAVRPAPAVLVTFHDLIAPYLFPKARRLRPWALRRLARDCDAVVVTNGDDWRELRADPAIAPKLQAIPIGSNIPPLPDAEREGAAARVRAVLGLGAGTPLLAYFGLVGGSKGVDTLLDALALLPEPRPHLALVGGGASETDWAAFGAAGDLRAAVAARGLAAGVTITGALPPERVAAHLAAADAVVLPYRDGASWRRGSLLAALAAAAPIVTTIPAAKPDTNDPLPPLTVGIDEGAALCAPPGDAAALAAAIARLLADAGLRARLAANARALAAHFAWPTIAGRHLELYRALTEGDR